MLGADVTGEERRAHQVEAHVPGGEEVAADGIVLLLALLPAAVGRPEADGQDAREIHADDDDVPGEELRLLEELQRVGLGHVVL